MVLARCTIAVDDSCSDYVRVVRGNTSDRDGFAEEVNIVVAFAGICAGEDDDNIAIIGIVDCCLDIVEIRRAVIIDGDYFGLSGDGQEQANPQQQDFFHSGILRALRLVR